MPRDVVDLCHEGGLLVNMCGKVRHAIEAAEAGCDIVVAQGTEAGGHTGRVATMALVPQVVDAVGDRVPVVAAGGIVDGRGSAAALALGADGVWIAPGSSPTATPRSTRAARPGPSRSPPRSCELFPAGQGVGAIDQLVPAADLVHQIVDEAEAVLAKLRPQP